MRVVLLLRLLGPTGTAASKNAFFSSRPGSGSGRRHKPSPPPPPPPVPSSLKKKFTYLALHKPFQVLSQFSPVEGKRTLVDVLPATTPRDVYPVGRLDYDSEGLLFLTNDTKVNHLLLHPTRHHEREYLVQVEGEITHYSLEKLRQGGLVLNLGKGKVHETRPCLIAERVATEGEDAAPSGVGPREPPIRVRKFIPTSWVRLCLNEGKNRQVRRMVAAVGFPCLRLLRWRVEGLNLKGLGLLLPGQVRELTQEEVYTKLKLPTTRQQRK